MPTERVVVKERIVVGQAVPETVVLSQIPEAPEYSYTVVNEERVIVDPQTRKVVQIIR